MKDTEKELRDGFKDKFPALITPDVAYGSNSELHQSIADWWINKISPLKDQPLEKCCWRCMKHSPGLPPKVNNPGCECLCHQPLEKESWEYGSLMFDEFKNIMEVCHVRDVEINADSLSISFVPKSATGKAWKELREKMLQTGERLSAKTKSISG